MPRERNEFFRDSGTNEREKVFVIAYEGNDTERQYFESLMDDARFDGDIVCLHLLSRPKGDTNSAPNHVFSKLKKEAKDEYNFSASDQLWMVIDRDRWRNIPEIIDKCKAEGNMYVAGSNPCFELWLLLHLKDLPEFTPAEQDEIFANKRRGNKTHIERVLANLLGGSYNKTNLQCASFLPNLPLAIERAELLDNPKEDFPSKLGSHVYKIAKAIIR